MSYEDPEDDFDEEGYFSEVDDGDDTGLAPKFVKLPALQRAPTELADAKVDDLFATYIELRNQLSTDRKGYKARESKVKAQMATVASILLNRSLALGVSGLSAPTGTGYQQTKESFRVAPDGWKSLTDWVAETGNFHVLQKRVSPNAVKEVREETGSEPPGLEVIKEQTFVVRSPTARKK